ncbi:MAG: zinc ribbon domain-containing protein [Oscillospiraceae bacterium]|nr:zinc ribbon domain-containing protein [Oscillospiraceae bacterium]
MYCHRCGAEIPGDAAFCPKCGTQMVYADTTHQEPSTLGISVEQQNPTARSSPQPVALPSQTAKPVNTPINDRADFKQFVDGRVRTITKYQTAEELLKSKVSQKFVWLCFGIPALWGLNSLRWLPLSDVPVMVLAILVLGYVAKYIVDSIYNLTYCCRASSPHIKVDEDIDTDRLILFLNGHLKYLFPYFHEWDYLTTVGFGVKGVAAASLQNAADVASKRIRIGTEFGKHKSCFVEIDIYKETTGPDSVCTRCRFWSATRSPWSAKYACTVRTAPILQAAIEYYLQNRDATIDNVDVQPDHTPRKKSRIPFIVLGVVAAILIVVGLTVGLGRDNSVSDTNRDGSEIDGTTVTDFNTAAPASSDVETVTPISIGADEAERLINDWIDEHQLSSVCYPEYTGEGYLYYSEGPEVCKFNLMMSGVVQVPLLVDKTTGEIWADLEEETMLLDEYYRIFGGALAGYDNSSISENTGGLLFKGIPADQLLGSSYETIIDIFGEPDTSMFEGEEITYGNVRLNFDMWSRSEPYLSTVSSQSLEDFAYNGYALSADYYELAQIFGREPDAADVFYDTYSMAYNLDYMGSTARLTIDTPATAESSASTEVSISWWTE